MYAHVQYKIIWYSKPLERLSCTYTFYLCFPYQVCLTFGALILFAGLIVILVGYTTPARIEAFGEDDLLFVDR